MEKFTITRIYPDANGDSRFEDIEIELQSGGTIGYLSENYHVENLIFRKVIPSYDYDFHNAPSKQFIILLDGKIEIETSLGEKRIFTAGDVLQVEDIVGKGHRTKNLVPIKRKSLFITYR
jgi:hypothetical protein